jgi:putative transposase
LADGRPVRILTVIDVYTRECVAAVPARTFGGADVVQILRQMAVARALPKRIRVDNGTEFTSEALDYWAYWNGVELDFSRPAKPVDNTFIEAFNGTLRSECLSLHWFLGLEDLQRTLDAWRDDYNNRRPHSSLADVPPVEFRTGACCAPDCGQLEISPA